MAHTPTYMDIGKLARALRGEGWTVKRIAKDCGLTQQAVKRALAIADATEPTSDVTRAFPLVAEMYKLDLNAMRAKLIELGIYFQEMDIDKRGQTVLSVFIAKGKVVMAKAEKRNPAMATDLTLDLTYWTDAELEYDGVFQCLSVEE
jgi:hypothetical protein